MVVVTLIKYPVYNNDANFPSDRWIRAPQLQSLWVLWQWESLGQVKGVLCRKSPQTKVIWLYRWWVGHLHQQGEERYHIIFHCCSKYFRLIWLPVIWKISILHKIWIQVIVCKILWLFLFDSNLSLPSWV